VIYLSVRRGLSGTEKALTRWLARMKTLGYMHFIAAAEGEWARSPAIVKARIPSRLRPMKHRVATRNWQADSSAFEGRRAAKTGFLAS
jgi:hypothetical protein